MLPVGDQAVEAHSIRRVFHMWLGSQDRVTVADAVSEADMAQAAVAAVREALAATHPKGTTEEMVALEWRRQFQALQRITAAGVAVALTQIALAPHIPEALAA